MRGRTPQFPVFIAGSVLQRANASLSRRENAEKGRILLDKFHKKDIIIAVKQPKAKTKPVLRNGLQREGKRCKPLVTPQNSHFRAVCEEQNGLSPLSDH